MTNEEIVLPALPEGWRLLALADVAPSDPALPREWSVRVLCENGDFCSARGSSPRYAILAVIERISRDDVYSPCADPFNNRDASPPIDLVALLRIPPPPTSTRR
jgi:hypothetical protein